MFECWKPNFPVGRNTTGRTLRCHTNVYTPSALNAVTLWKNQLHCWVFLYTDALKLLGFFFWGGCIWMSSMFPASGPTWRVLGTSVDWSSRLSSALYRPPPCSFGQRCQVVYWQYTGGILHQQARGGGGVCSFFLSLRARSCLCGVTLW